MDQDGSQFIYRGSVTGMVPDVTDFEHEAADKPPSLGDIFDRTEDFERKERLVGAKSPLTIRTKNEQREVRLRSFSAVTKTVGSATPSYCGLTSTDDILNPHWSSTPIHRFPNNVTKRDTFGSHSSDSTIGRVSPSLSNFSTRLRQLLENTLRNQYSEGPDQSFQKWLADYDVASKAVEAERERLLLEKKKLDAERMKLNSEAAKLRIQQRKIADFKPTNDEELVGKLRAQLQKCSTENSAMRVKLQHKEKELKEVKDKYDKLVLSKESVTRTLDMKTKNHARELQNKDKEIKELRQQLDAAQKRKPGIQPRPQPLTISQPPPTPSTKPAIVASITTPRQVHFEERRNSTHFFENDDTFSEYSRCMDDMEFSHKIVPPVDKGDCWVYRSQDGQRIVNIFQIRHQDGSCCGALQYNYLNTRDTRWVFGSLLEVYHYGRHRIEVALKPINVRVCGSYYGVQIFRPSDSITQYNYDDGQLVETVLRRDEAAQYALVFQNGSSKPAVFGISDRRKEEDEQVIRRGSLNDPLEHMDRDGRNANIVTWQSHRLAGDISDYMVCADAGGRGMKMKVTLRNSKRFSILFNPNEYHNWVIIEHIDGENIRYPCCDMGHKARERERMGIQVNCGDLAKYV